MNIHRPVLLEEVVAGLVTDPSGLYVDCTFGRGGHSRAILQTLNEQGRLLAFDKDPEAQTALSEPCFSDTRFSFVSATFSQLEQVLKARDWLGQVSGVLMDLGVSTPQLATPERGFSFMSDGPLDMRMNPNEGRSAAEWLNTARADEIEFVLREYGEERYARSIARAIVAQRKMKRLATTGELRDLITQASPRREWHKHPATRSFMAIRIYINRELEELTSVLTQAGRALKTGGRMAVISFHSLEDRITKQFIRAHDVRKHTIEGAGDKQGEAFFLKALGKIIRPTRQEMRENPSARSAILRLAEKIR
jgi:16S rRNA (cytosine1402-N4)-methyltransferase